MITLAFLAVLPPLASAQPIKALAPAPRALIVPAATGRHAAPAALRMPALPAPALPALAAPAPLGALPGAPNVRALSVLAQGAAPLAAAMADLDWRRAAELGSALFGEGKGRGDIDGTGATAAPALNHYGKMFPNLPPRDASGFSIEDLGRAGGILDLTTEREARFEDDGVPAGTSFLGQFIDHDITQEFFSKLESPNDPAAIRNTRTPFLDLDSVYGVGRHYFRARRDGLLLGPADDDEYDLPRNREGTAIIPEHRNDENVVISQLHVAFLKLENKLRREHDAETAHRLAVWHYQWIVLHEFLPTVVGQAMVNDILANGRRFYLPEPGKPYLPVEFTHAAYRFGHSTIRNAYRINDAVEAGLFPSAPDAPPGNDLRGGRPLPKEFVVDWSKLFKMEEGKLPKSWLIIGPWAASPLLNLPDGVRPPDHPERSLLVRNMKRADALGVASGQDIARAMGIRPYADEEFWKFFREVGFPVAHDAPIPLWLYVVVEARLAGERTHLGPVGGRIVGETLIGLVQTDPNSFINAAPAGWTPTIPSAKPGEFTIADLLRYAGQ